jgi:plastocyanin
MNRRKKYYSVLWALGVCLLLTGVLARTVMRKEAAAPASVEIRIDNFAFAPAEITITSGTTVNWMNRDDIPHTVVSEDKTTFKSKALDTDDTFSYTFSKPGTYSYFCSVHPKMTGKVVVQ